MQYYWCGKDCTAVCDGKSPPLFLNQNKELLTLVTNITYQHVLAFMFKGMHKNVSVKKVVIKKCPFLCIVQ